MNTRNQMKGNKFYSIVHLITPIDMIPNTEGIISLKKNL